ncbi:MAG TPA: hypothetical protein VHP57_04945, partial [Acidimicrobiia bacterium]|nr:hypothetical protein [Acidimicrobiia bacterium]
MLVCIDDHDTAAGTAPRGGIFRGLERPRGDEHDGCLRGEATQRASLGWAHSPEHADDETGAAVRPQRREDPGQA